MAEIEHGGPACDAAISLAFSVLGKRWNGMIIDALSGGALSFVALRRAVTGISDAVLSDRLSELAGVDLVSREVHAGPPVSVDYALTPAGEALVPVLAQLGTWASENLRVVR
ncbi:MULTISPECIES: winged helix-turn-helix transcriptional regulator [Microbacterium]|uniref:Helix-turn-helix domain-containing protein n=1 Tax=Microbacterium gilvum TaxID=1336204 RepID=A0ABP9AK25_9MICO